MSAALAANTRPPSVLVDTVQRGRQQEHRCVDPERTSPITVLPVSAVVAFSSRSFLKGRKIAPQLDQGASRVANLPESLLGNAEVPLGSPSALGRRLTHF